MSGGETKKFQKAHLGISTYLHLYFRSRSFEDYGSAQVYKDTSTLSVGSTWILGKRMQGDTICDAEQLTDYTVWKEWLDNNSLFFLSCLIRPSTWHAMPETT